MGLAKPVRHLDLYRPLVDAPKWKDAVALPSGIILVPFTEVQRLPDDSQLAVVLADKIAWLIEGQPLILRTGRGAVQGRDRRCRGTVDEHLQAERIGNKSDPLGG